MSRDRALLPDLIKFSYIPQSEHRIHADAQLHKGKERFGSPPYTVATRSSTSVQVASTLEEDEHVLVLEFAELGKPRSRKEDLLVRLIPSLFIYSHYLKQP